MHMRNLFVILLLIGAGFLLHRFFSPSETKPLSDQPRVSEVEPTPTEVKVLPKVTRPIHALSPHSQAVAVDERFTQVPKDQIVDFKLVDGLAVAFGDTVLGKPAPGFNQNAGLTEIRPTRTWKSFEIPFAIDESIKNKAPINQALELFQTRTNIRFIPYSNQEDALVFTLGKENCMSSLGRIGGLQPVYLEPNCGKLEIAHEIMHALGFAHEQSRTDRDRYVSILWENIQAPYQSQFEMIPEALMDVYGDTPFDPNSILMYSPHIFSTSPNVETMKLKNGAPIENAPNGLSDIDVMRVNRLYQN